MTETASGGIALMWSGGKDSALAVWALREEHGLRPQALITTITEDYGRVSMHAVRRELLAEQARLVGAELVEVAIPAECDNSLYEQRMAQALSSERLRGVGHVAAGDLFLQDVRAYRESQIAAAGKLALFPLWRRNTSDLSREFIEAGFEAVLVCVDPSKLDGSFAGRRFDADLLADLPPDVDPCGENGEFHTFVFAGPIFSRPLACRTGEVVQREGFVFCDVLAA